MKKILLTFSCFLMTGIFVFASVFSEGDARKFFDEYVKAANSFEEDLFTKYYSKSPAIYRVVEKKDGTKKTVKIPFKKYKSEASKKKTLAKMAGYENNYSNIIVTTSGNDFRIDAMRNPSPGGSYAAYFIIGPDKSGALKIKTESMNTPRTEFLKD